MAPPDKEGPALDWSRYPFWGRRGRRPRPRPPAAAPGLTPGEKAAVLAMTGIVLTILGVLVTAGKEEGKPLATGPAATIRRALTEPPAAWSAEPLPPPRAPAPAKLDRVFGPWPGKKKKPAKGTAPPRPRPRVRLYRVRAGDVLSEIARRELGSARRWREILALNPGLEPKRLQVGQKIRLPARKGRRP